MIEEIETEYALKHISEQNHNRVIVPPEFQNEHTNSSVALMAAENVDNLENTLSGAGTSHRVNSILSMNKQSGDTANVQVDENCERPSKRKYKRSLSQILLQKKSLSTFPGKGWEQENSPTFRTLPANLLMMISRQPRECCTYYLDRNKEAQNSPHATCSRVDWF